MSIFFLFCTLLGRGVIVYVCVCVRKYMSKQRVL